MNLLDLFRLSLVEGVADLLPVDSAGHALLLLRLTGWRVGSIIGAIHLGAAIATLLFLWRDVLQIGLGLWRLRKMRLEPGTLLLLKALLAALPWILCQSLLDPGMIAGMASLVLCGVVTMVAAIVMGVVDRLCMTVKRIEHIGGVTAIIVGIVTLGAAVPGVGRTAAALTAARLMGLERPAAYRFVLLAQAPILLVAGIRESLLRAGQEGWPAVSDGLATLLTLILVLVALPLAMALMRRFGLLFFSIYRLALGAALVLLAIL